MQWGGLMSSKTNYTEPRIRLINHIWGPFTALDVLCLAVQAEKLGVEASSYPDRTISNISRTSTQCCTVIWRTNTKNGEEEQRRPLFYKLQCGCADYNMSEFIHTRAMWPLSNRWNSRHIFCDLHNWHSSGGYEHLNRTIWTSVGFTPCEQLSLI